MWPDATQKACSRWVLGRSGKTYVGEFNAFFFHFALSFFVLLFLLFLFFAAPVSVTFFVVLFFAIIFAVLVRPLLCVCWSCCLVAFVLGRDNIISWVSAFCLCFFVELLGFF